MNNDKKGIIVKNFKVIGIKDNIHDKNNKNFIKELELTIANIKLKYNL